MREIFQKTWNSVTGTGSEYSQKRRAKANAQRGAKPVPKRFIQDVNVYDPQSKRWWKVRVDIPDSWIQTLALKAARSGRVAKALITENGEQYCFHAPARAKVVRELYQQQNNNDER